MAPYELGFKVDIDALLAGVADMAVLAAQACFFALAMIAAVTLPSWPTSRCLEARAAGRFMQTECLGWLRACVWDPSSSQNVSECRCLRVGVAHV